MAVTVYYPNGGMLINSHHWTSAEDIMESRERAVIKTVEVWVYAPWLRVTDPKGRGSGPFILDTVEILCDPTEL